jgi:hypothetical protein
MNTQKLRIQIRLNLQKGKEEKFPIYIGFYIDGKKAEMATRHYVESRSRDAKTSRVKNTCLEAVLINGYLERVQN